MNIRLLLLSLTFLSVTIQIVGCGDPEDTHDYYSEVAFDENGAPLCAYTTLTHSILSPDPANPRLRENCKKALEAILPYDSDGANTFKDAPAGAKDLVTEAFQAFVGYPLVFPPNNMIFGVSPGAIPAWFVKVFSKDGNVNKSLFNFIVQALENIRFEKVQAGDSAARFDILTGSKGVMTIYPLLFEPSSPLEAKYPSPFDRAASMAHEAWHSLGFFHSDCPGTEGFSCDVELNGPYGMDVFYWELLLHGAGNIQSNGAPPSLTNIDVTLTGRRMCSVLKESNKYLPPDLNKLIANTNCDRIDYDWMLQHENLDRPDSP